MELLVDVFHYKHGVNKKWQFNTSLERLFLLLHSFSLYTQIYVCAVDMYNHMTKLWGYMEDLIKPNNSRGIHDVENKIKYVREDVGISTFSNVNIEDC